MHKMPLSFCVLYYINTNSSIYRLSRSGQRARSRGTKTECFDPFGGLRAVFVW